MVRVILMIVVAVSVFLAPAATLTREVGPLDEAQDVSQGVVQFPVFASIGSYTGWPYVTHVKLGTPQKEFTVLIDTGSDNVWVPCMSCSNCPTSKLDAYDPKHSSTSSVVGCSNPWCKSSIDSGLGLCQDSSDHNNAICSYDIIYGGGGTVGYFVTDMMHFDTIGGNNAGFSSLLTFGCSYLQSGGLTQKNIGFNGIVGIGPNEESLNSQINSLGLAPIVFSLCLNSSGNGTLIFGEAVAEGLQYTPLGPIKYHYSVFLEGISVNGQRLQIDPSLFTSRTRKTFVDSGTDLAYFPDDAYDTILNAISSAATLSPSVRAVVENGVECFVISASLDSLFPTVTLSFAGGAEMILKPQNYLVPQGLLDEQPMYCMGWKRQQGKPNTILGDIILMNKLIVHDLENMRWGFVNYDCSQPVEITTSNHWNNTSKSWNKRPASSGHLPYNGITPTGVVLILACVLIF